MSELATTQLSSKGQVVIPEAIRKKLRLKPGSKFIVVGKKGTVILKEITLPSMDEFEELLLDAKKQAKKVGLTPTAIKRAIKKTRY